MRMRQFAALWILVLISCGGPPQSAPAPTAEKSAHRRTVAAPVETAADEPDAKQFLEVDWGTLRGLDVRTGATTPLIELAIGTPVRIAGYLVPFDDGLDQSSEFLVVPGAGLCVHLPPPPPNQIILAEMQGPPARMLTGAVWVYGRLEVQTATTPYAEAGYKLYAQSVRPVK
jgi:hypothetical protein